MSRVRSLTRAIFDGFCSCIPLLVSLSVSISACHSQIAEPAPPPPRFELVAAAPGARGARAAGTDAAPTPQAEAPSEPEDPAEAEDDGEGGSHVDAGSGVTPDTDGGVAL